MMSQVAQGASLAATRPLSSVVLRDAVAMQGMATQEEETAGNSGGSAAGLYARRFQLQQTRVIHGSSPADQAAGPLRFVGYTAVPPDQRVLDVQTPAVSLDGPGFFDSALPSGPVPVVLIIGGPPATPPLGTQGQSAVLDSGSRKGQPVRVFLLEGGNRTLASALPSLVGWQQQADLHSTEQAIAAGHPLVALDALRIAAATHGATAQLLLLSRYLLHPAQFVGARVIALDLLGQAASQMQAGSQEANALLVQMVSAWEAERQYPLDSAYLKAFQAASAQVRASARLTQVKAIATDDFEAQQRSALKKQLAASLKP